MARPIYLERGLELSPFTLKRMLESIDPSRYDERLGPDRFSLREVVAHLVDFDLMIRSRMELALASPGAVVPVWDEDAEAAAHNYATLEVAPTLDKLLKGRAKTVELFKSLSEEQQKQTVTHAVRGPLSILDLGVFELGHDSYHLEQVSHYLR